MGSTHITDAPARPMGPDSGVRYRVLGFLCCLSFVLYIDRICIGQAADAMMAELELNKTAMGLVFGAFTISYALFEVPTGRWGDRFGSRKVLVRIVLWWSAFTALTGCVVQFVWDVPFQVTYAGIPLFGSLGMLLLVRFLFGAGEAGALPNAARILSRWFPDGRRGPAQGMITTANLIGGAVAPILTAYIIRAAGWRWAFIAFGSLGIVWAVVFARWFRDDPAEHPQVNPVELDLIRRGTRPQGHADAHPPIPWKAVYDSRNVWLLGFALTCASAVSYMYFGWYPTYLKQGRGVPEQEAGWLTGLVLAGGAVGSLAGGFLGDWLRRLTGDRSWSLRLLGVCGMFCASVFLVAGIQFDSPALAAGLTAAACFSANVQLASWWAVVTEITGRHLGTLFGLMNAVGLVGAFASQTLLGAFADRRQELGYVGRDQWDPAFYLYALLLLAAAVAWWWVDADQEVEPSALQDVGRERNHSSRGS